VAKDRCEDEAAVCDWLEGRLALGVAGLWDRWRDPATKERLETFTVTTTEPDEVVEPMHNRMPVIIQPKE
jgi:putative SOS response-associated peptidase YedK